MRYGFLLFDDELLIIDNPKIRGLNWANIKAIFTTYDPELYIPITLFTHQIEHTLFGLNAHVIHLVNVLLHIVSSLLVFRIFSRFFHEKVALVTGLLFAIHPLTVETVVWASARKDLLSALFFLWSFLAYLKAKERGATLWKSVIIFCFGLLSKVSIAPLPLVLLLTDWVTGRYEGWASIREKWAYFIPAIAFVIIAIAGKQTQAAHASTAVLLSFVSIPFYIGKTIVPTGLSIFYPFMDTVSLLHPRILFGILFILVVILGTWWKRKKFPWLFYGWWVFLCLVAPSLTNVVKGGYAGTYDLYFASDRYMYLSILGVLAFVGSILTHKNIKTAYIVIGIFGILAFRQTHVWSSSDALFKNATNTSASYIAYNNLAGLRAQQGELQKAEELYHKSLEIKESPLAYFSLAQIVASQGRSTDAIALYQSAIQMSPKHVNAYTQLGGLLLMTGNVPAAKSALSSATNLDNNIPSVHYNLGLIYEHEKSFDLARASYEKVLALDPSDTQAAKKLEGLR